MVCSPAKPASTIPCTKRCVASLIRTVSGSAKACRRAAKLTVSPRTVALAAAPSCTLPTTAAPVLRPIRKCGRTPCLASRLGPSVLSRCRIDSAARHARNGASSKATGAPNGVSLGSHHRQCHNNSVYPENLCKKNCQRQHTRLQGSSG